MKLNKAAAILICFLLLCAVSCAGIAGKYRSESRLEIKNNKKAVLAELRLYENRAELRSVFLPGIVFAGEVKEDGQNFSFYIVSARFFSNWPNGWTEGRYQASGKLDFQKRGNGWTCSVADGFELWNIEWGQIRFHDEFYRGDDGLARVKNRIDRIMETVRIVNELNNTEFYNSLKKKIGDRLPFSKDVQNILFPEKAGFARLEQQKLLPEAYYAGKDAHPEERVLGTDFFWRADYTRAVFPENIHELRNSGTLWKDFEESPEIFYSLYNLEYFFSELLDNDTFAKIN